MDENVFNKIIDGQIEECRRILAARGEQYACCEDKLHNFKTAAALQGCTMTQALVGMLAKHTVSVYDMCMSHDKFPFSVWREKITDHINYLLILIAIIAEEENFDKSKD